MCLPLSAATVGYSGLTGAVFDPDGLNSTGDALEHTLLGSLSLNDGDSITFNTTNGTFSTSTGQSGTVGIASTYESSTGDPYAVFNFSTISIDAGVTIEVEGSNGLAILSQGDFTLNSNLDFSGQDGTFGTSWRDIGSAPTAGGNISLVAEGTMSIGSGASVNANGGDGGNVYTWWNPAPDGDQGAQAGDISLAANNLILNGSIEAIGGTGGDGRNQGTDNGGSGGDGGDIVVVADAYNVTGGTIENTGGATGGGANPATPVVGEDGTFNGALTDNPGGGAIPLPGDDIITPPSYIAIPEPSSAFLIVTAGLLYLMRRKRCAA
ncbi:PEP-CTERM sorting domain-containing protein [Rubritalea tangerina]|uniref:PEP-CTERM sorting domain-containing protein n=1 Tax=Rubritalea tangerina TaxID=430798 RepID=UPI00360BA4B4